MYYIGIDIGSTNIKMVLFKDDIICMRMFSSTYNPKECAMISINELIEEYNLSEYKIIVTGYGRDLLLESDYSLTEISAHALGGYYLNNDIKGIIDIGGQDCKVISINKKKVIDFIMNDRCAAGTGSFLSKTCDKLEIDIDEIDLIVNDNETVEINSMCAVFAESEIISLLAKNTSRHLILAGVIVSIAKRIKQMVLKTGFSKDSNILLTGGLSNSKVVLSLLSKVIDINIISDDKAIYAGAIGACLYGKEKENNLL